MLTAAVHRWLFGDTLFLSAVSNSRLGCVDGVQELRGRIRVHFSVEPQVLLDGSVSRRAVRTSGF